MPFRDLKGDRRIVDLLARAIDRRSLPPSLIFAGPEGADQGQAAIAVAQRLNCTTLPPDTPRAVERSRSTVDRRHSTVDSSQLTVGSSELTVDRSQSTVDS